MHLTPKAFSVLDYLARHANRLVTKHELLDHVWPEVHVGDAVLKVAIREIRHALHDDSSAPRFVQTARRVGYRFLAPVSSVDLSQTAEVAFASKWPVTSPLTPQGRPLVGRADPLGALGASLAQAMSGTRQLVFVVGEAGIGKTSVVEAFLSQVERDEAAWVLRGQCVEHVGGAEAYLPVLDALSRLGRGRGRELLLATLRRFAPTWLAQMPALVEAREALRNEILGATPERMLREIAEALEALTSDAPLLLFLDDLHWSDAATLDFVGTMAHRTERCRLMLIAAYRPVDVALSRPVLQKIRRDLAARRLCKEVQLDFLTPSDTTDFLEARFPAHAFPSDFAALIHQRTNGSPLFMTDLMDYLVAQGMARQRDGRWELQASLEAVTTAAPDTLRHLTEAQLARLTPEEYAALAAASVSGIDFAATAVAAGLGISDEAAETCLDGLAGRGQFVVSAGLAEAPDHAWSPSYHFVHSLHQEVLYRSLPAARRLRLHRRVAERIERDYGEHVGPVASELGEHFEQAREYPKAIRYLRLAAANETRRFANREASVWLDRALNLATNLSREESSEIRVAILNDLGRVRRSMGDMRASSQAFCEAARTATDRGDSRATVESLLLAASASTWFDRDACLAAGREAERLAAAHGPPLLTYVRGYSAYWYLLWGPWDEEQARDCERALALAQQSAEPLRLFSMLPRCAYVRLARGQYVSAATAASEGGGRALAAEDAFGLMACQFYRAWAELLAGRWGITDALLADSLQLAERNGHRSWEILFAALRAWLLREAGAPDSARIFVEPFVTAARSLSVPIGELVAETQLGLAMLDASRRPEGFGVLSSLMARLDREPMLMGWIWRMPLHIGLSDAHRHRGAWAEAETEAQRACDLAAASGERTWLARGYTALAEAALAQAAHGRARQALDRAAEALRHAHAPIAAWRMHACASRAAAAQGHFDLALEHRDRAAAEIASLADSLPATSDLYRSFLDGRDVRIALTAPMPHA